MAEGGGFDPKTFDWEKFERDNPGIFENDDKDEGNVTHPFTPAEAPTPRYRGEEFEMQTRHQEHTGLPSYEEEETYFGGNVETMPLIEKRFSELKRNEATGILDISDTPNPKEDFLPDEVKQEQKERAKNMPHRSTGRVLENCEMK